MCHLLVQRRKRPNSCLHKLIIIYPNLPSSIHAFAGGCEGWEGELYERLVDAGEQLVSLVLLHLCLHHQLQPGTSEICQGVRYGGFDGAE